MTRCPHHPYFKTNIFVKITRKLHDRLALASYKIQNGLDGLSFPLVEAHVKDLTRKKTAASVQASSSDSSSTSSEHLFRSRHLESPSNAAPFFSDDISAASRDTRFRGKRLFQTTSIQSDVPHNSRKRLRMESMGPPMLGGHRASWKSAHNLPESSPIQRHDSWKYSTSHAPNLSFVSESSTIPDSPPLGPSSQEDLHDLPEPPFRASHGHFHGSPPRTPPPTRSRSSRIRKDNGNEEGADLLLYLATSPSPANPTRRARPATPSTPPSNTPALPSSLMLTPGGGNMFNGFHTPGQTFNFADYINVTPSPAQGAFGNRTPGPAKTPVAAKEARRRLNFDTLAPPGQSPNPGAARRDPTTKGTGLGMELGGELVSS